MQYTKYYTVETRNLFGEWSPQAIYYAVKNSDTPATEQDISRVWTKALDLAQSFESIGKKAIITSGDIVKTESVVWEGK